MTSGVQEAYAALESHVRRFFKRRSVTSRRWSGIVPNRVPDDFRVLELAPSRAGEPWAYVSLGNWEYVHAGRCSLEFILLAPSQSERHVELLTMTAFYDRHEHLDLGHVFPLGEPWLPGSALDVLLVSLPYPFGPALENAHVGEKHVRFLWLLPITQAERAYRLEYGLDALEDQFEAKGLEYWRPDRVSLVVPPNTH